MSSVGRRPIRSAILLTALAFLSSGPAEGSLEIAVGPTVGSTSPRDPAYRDRFLTPGASWGGCIHLGSDGFLGFELSAERFTKEGPRGWDGRVRALLLSAWPMAEYDPIEGVGIYAGPGVVYADGSYSGTDDFGRYVEADGSSAGFGLAVGTSVDLWG
ncbi:hypothetical protein GF402_09200, partial [Candidatus Fermentibacteria bacterium]|nr:hypothetical protein [Candidatus Fermentibacteria bacterium]